MVVLSAVLSAGDLGVSGDACGTKGDNGESSGDRRPRRRSGGEQGDNVCLSIASL